MLLNTFEQAWSSGDLDDVTDAVVDNISQMYRENPPELVYYAALYRIFHEFLDDITADELPKEGTGFRESKIWNLLYDFQRDAVLAIINKLQTYDGCILADSVGLGKTFTALAVVKYYESLNRNVLVLCPKKLGDNWLTYRNNCILADSVGLGKTFTALAVVKYYESLNRNVLVLCPKKLGDNWLTYRNNQRNNPIAADRLRYDVLYHTDLSRQRGTSVTGLDLETINWGAYDLVVIDESHNFRNGADSSRAARDGEEASENRYERLLNRVVKDGVPTKVLMLSATPVNNRFRDLRNQLALAYQGDPEQWSERLGLESNVEDVFRRAQGAFTRWSELPAEERTTEALTRSLDFDFFRILDQVTESNVEDVFRRAQGAFTRWSELPAEERTTEALTRSLDFDFFRILDQVTVARSRNHIQRYYDAAAIGPFPRRNKPVSLRPDLCTEDGPATYDAIAERLYELELAIYVPMKYVQPSRKSKYEDGDGKISVEGREKGVQYDAIAERLYELELAIYVPMKYVQPSRKSKYEDGDGKISVEGREKGVQRLMAANLLKRLESSVASFRLTLQRVLAHMEHTLDAIDRFRASGTSVPGDLLEDANGFDYDVDDEETSEFMVGKKARYDLHDMDWVSWERDVMADARLVRDLLDLIAPIDPERDAKLSTLKQVIVDKVTRPINAGNRKVIVFTAFADTAHYLYEQLRPLVVDELGLGMAEVTGAAGSKTTVDGVRADLSEILTCFSPVSKERDQVSPATCWRMPTASTTTWMTRKPRSSWWARRPAMICTTWTGSAGSAMSWRTRGSCATSWISSPRSIPSAMQNFPRSSRSSWTRSPVPSTPATARLSFSLRLRIPRITLTSSCARWWWMSWASAWPRSRAPRAARPQGTACVPTSRRSSPALAPYPRSATRWTRA